MRELWGLIPDEYRKGCVRVAVSVPCKAILDLVGVAVLVPVMMLLLNPEKLQVSFLGKISTRLNFTLDISFPLFVISGVVLVLLVKIALSMLIINHNSRYLMSLYRNLSSRLFTSLYSRGLTFIKNQNSARMTFNVTGVCYNFVMGYLGGWISLLGDMVFVLLMLVALYVYSGKATLMAICAFVPVVALYLLFVKKPLNKISSAQNEVTREQNRLIYEAFRGYSEVQVNDAFPMIQRRFNEGLNSISSYRVKSGIIQSIPSYLLELSVVAIVAIIILFKVNTSNASDLVFLGVFTVALLKLLPAVRGIISSLTALNATEYTREVIADIKTPAVFRLIHDNEIKAMPFNDSIRVNEVSFCFQDEYAPVIENLSMEIKKGERFGIQGRTGVGKTTLFNLLLGLYMPQKGSVSVDGTVLTVDNVASWHKSIGYVPQEVFISDGTILENVALGFEAGDIDRAKVEKVLEQASLSEFVASLPKGLDTSTGEAGCKMSGGQRQRLGIARALYKDASVLFFDEATSSLDTVTEKEVNDAIERLSDKNRELTFIVISHRDSTLAFCDRILRL